jgi:hypothetical protein
MASTGGAARVCVGGMPASAAMQTLLTVSVFLAQAKGGVPEEVLAMQVDPAAFEMCGHIVLKRAQDYETVTQVSTGICVPTLLDTNCQILLVTHPMACCLHVIQTSAFLVLRCGAHQVLSAKSVCNFICGSQTLTSTQIVTLTDDCCNNLQTLI